MCTHTNCTPLTIANWPHLFLFTFLTRIIFLPSKMAVILEILIRDSCFWLALLLLCTLSLLTVSMQFANLLAQETGHIFVGWVCIWTSLFITKSSSLCSIPLHCGPREFTFLSDVCLKTDLIRLRRRTKNPSPCLSPKGRGMLYTTALWKWDDLAKLLLPPPPNIGSQLWALLPSFSIMISLYLSGWRADEQQHLQDTFTVQSFRSPQVSSSYFVVLCIVLSLSFHLGTLN